MSQETKIEWADCTFNPWIGCTKVSPACDNCYAEAQMDKRLHKVNWGPGNPRKRTSPENWEQPLRWNKLAGNRMFVECTQCGKREFRREDIFCSTHGCVSFPECDNNRARPRVFCSSLADWLDNEIDIEWFVDLMDIIRQTSNLDWLLLTKRIGNFYSRMQQATRYVNVYQKGEALFDWLKKWECSPPENVWMGITVIDQDEANRDIPKLLETPAKLRFLSIEPMLGPVDLTKIERTQTPGYFGDCLQWYHRPFSERDTKWNGINWVIAGGESGRNARPIHPEWIRSLRDRCINANVPFLFKQWGEWAPEKNIALDGSPFSMTWQNNAAMHICERGERIYRVGKKRAGRTIDNETWNQFPESVQ